MNKLPQPITEYVEAANAQDTQRAAACFHEDATVHDEGHTHRGREEIVAWVAESGEKYSATIEPIDLEEADGRHILRTTVCGSFPGSPVALNFDFQLRAGSIQSLEVKP
ncbi:nuclear transport factor 2 family protein [Oxalobacteraceae bacterium OTU3CINTB1]|nr:nuclear transport factor 2 family protein [Oxalobacteraceae bacterium OTU3CINTB1]